MEQQRRLHRDGFSEEEAQRVVRRALELQQESESHNTVPRAALEAGAESVGVRPEFVQQAIDELQFEQTTARSAGRTAQRAGWNPWIVAGILFLIAFVLFFSTYFLTATPTPVAPTGPPAVVREVPERPRPPLPQGDPAPSVAPRPQPSPPSPRPGG